MGSTPEKQITTTTKGMKNAANHDTVEALVFHQCFFQCLLKLRQIDEILESKDAHDVAAHIRFTE